LRKEDCLSPGFPSQPGQHRETLFQRKGRKEGREEGRKEGRKERKGGKGGRGKERL
jgi:hypothetical protein